MQDMIALVNTQNFNWDIVWEEIEKQDKDTGKIVFVTILENMDCLVQQGSTPIPFHKKLLIKAIDEMICKTIRNKWMFKDEIVSDMIGNDVTEKMMETRINHLVRIRLIKEGRTKDDKTFLRTTKANVLRYISLDTFYDPDHFIDYGNLIRKIEILSSRLGLSERYSRIAKGIADIIGRDSVFISNRIANLVPAIVYTVIRTYKLPMTRKAISIHANVSEPSITGLYHKITTSLKKHFNK